jgi:isoquinoline 1-oxidoreductase subunit beta
MTPIQNVSRRNFLKASAAFSGALLLGFRLGEAEAAASGQAAVFNPNAWLEITPENNVTIYVPWTELGQGVMTAVPLLLAEELEADWNAIDILMAWNDPRFGGMGTGGSRSVRASWDPVRQAGATARVMLIEAAASLWKVPVNECKASKGVIKHTPTSRSVTFGAVVQAAGQLEVPVDVPLKSRQQRTLIGSDVPRTDFMDKITGKTEFGMDQRVDGMVYATLEECPVFGGSMKSFDATKALQVPGVLSVKEISAGLAVVATGTWAAIKGKEALEVEWDYGPHANLDSAAISKQLSDAREADGQVMKDAGDFASAMSDASQEVSASYDLPFLSHSPIEPINCTARITGDKVEVWAPIQSTSWGVSVAAQAAGVDAANVRLQPTFTGGGFGRRLMVEYVGQCVEIAKATGKPVQLFRTPEDGFHHGFFRPASRHNLAAGFDENGMVTAWKHHIAAPSIGGQLNPASVENGRDESAVSGAVDMNYTFANQRVVYNMSNTAVPACWLRSVYNTQNGLVNECFMDEVAHKMGVDPLELRLRHLPAGNRLAGTLERAAKAWGWPAKAPSGYGHGIACHASFGSYVTNIAEVNVVGSKIQVTRVLSCIDCGPVVHPDGLRSQMEGVVAFALSALLGEEITIKNGRVEQNNFDDYYILRLDAMPEVEVIMVDSDDAIGGVGEPGYPPLGPAVLNALFAATGQRIRRLPLSGSFKG